MLCCVGALLMAPAQLMVVAAVQGGLAISSGGGTKKGRIGWFDTEGFVCLIVTSMLMRFRGDCVAWSGGWREERRRERGR